MDEQGMVKIYTLKNVAPAGLKPVKKLVYLEDDYFEERQVGVTRLYAAKNAEKRIDSLIRVFNSQPIVEGMVAEIGSVQYQIDATQKEIGKDSVLLTLIRLEKNYEIYQPAT
jgi:hypothetical protein